MPNPENDIMKLLSEVVNYGVAKHAADRKRTDFSKIPDFMREAIDSEIEGAKELKKQIDLRLNDVDNPPEIE